jgi:hypothetical protein
MIVQPQIFLSPQPKTTKMDISNPRRILAVSRPDSGLPELLKGKENYNQAQHEILTT